MNAKPVNWRLIEHTESPEIYEFINDIIRKFHGGDSGIEGVNILLMWKYNNKPDQDGYITLASITKSSDQVRELLPHDFIMGINNEVWSTLDVQQRTVVVDSQLERIAICLDNKKDIKEDDRGRTVYRLKKQLAVDEEVIRRRHGMTLNEVQEFAYDKLYQVAEPGSYVHGVLSDPS